MGQPGAIHARNFFRACLCTRMCNDNLQLIQLRGPLTMIKALKTVQNPKSKRGGTEDKKLRYQKWPSLVLFLRTRLVRLILILKHRHPTLSGSCRMHRKETIRKFIILPSLLKVQLKICRSESHMNIGWT